MSSKQIRQSSHYPASAGPAHLPQGSVDDVRGDTEQLDPGQPAGSPLVGPEIVEQQGRWRWGAFKILPECSVGGPRALDSDPREAPGSKLAWSQLQRVSLLWMMVSGLRAGFIVVCPFKINSSVKDGWNLSLPNLPLCFIFSCRHLSLLRIRRALLISKSLLEIESLSRTRHSCWNMEVLPGLEMTEQRAHLSILQSIQGCAWCNK